MSSNVSADFDNGGSYLLSEANYDRFVSGQDPIGRADGQFVAPSNQIDDMINSHPNEPREWEKQLGLNEGSLGDNPYRVDVNNPQNYNLRAPSDNMSGVNDKYLGTGKLPGGQDEGAIDSFPNPEQHSEVGKVCPAKGVDHFNELAPNYGNKPKEVFDEIKTLDIVESFIDDLFIRDIRNAGFTPTNTLVKNIKDYQNITNTKFKLSDAAVIYKNADALNEKSLGKIKEIGNELKAQEIKIIQNFTPSQER